MIAAISRATRPVARMAIASSSKSFSTSSLRLAAAPAPTKKAIGSALPAGRKMEGLSVLKDKPDPVALEDSEYPAWLWTLLDKPAASNEDGKFDFHTQRKQLRANNRSKIRTQNYLKTT